MRSWCAGSRTTWCWLKLVGSTSTACLTGFALLEGMRFGAKSLRKFLRIINTMLSHQLLQFGWSRLSSRLRDFQNGRCLGRNWGPFMQLLSKEVGLVRQQNLSAFNLSKIEPLGIRFIGCGENWVAERRDDSTEIRRICDDVLEHFFFIWLERKIRDLVLPQLQVFQLWSSCVTRDFDSPVANRASVLFIFFDFATSNLEAFAVIPDID